MTERVEAILGVAKSIDKKDMIWTIMRTSKTLSVSLPPAQLKQAEALAKKENRTMSELIREALRHYQRERELDDINAYGRAKAAELGITEDDVIPLIKQYRRERRQEKIKTPRS
jgi:CopG family transcriptional regulator / antitoxin EndoAI